jgi:F-type H+-transporting ATPase subunit delta
MKISARQYAQCLYELVSNESDDKVKEILPKFVVLLEKHRALSLAPAVIAAFTEIWNREHGEVVAELTSARELKSEAKELIVDYLKNKSGAREVILDEQVDYNILGGFVLKYNNKIIDASLRSSLAELKNQMMG